MQRVIGLLACASLALSAVAAHAATGAMTVELKQSRRIALSGQAANIVIGDPTVADVAMVDARSVIVVGKGYGSTDVLVLDRSGHTLLDSQVSVVAADDGRVTVFRGAGVQDFSCAHRCQAMGDPAGPAHDQAAAAATAP